eukprot:6486333-Amphidinium_carterae.1
MDRDGDESMLPDDESRKRRPQSDDFLRARPKRRTDTPERSNMQTQLNHALALLEVFKSVMEQNGVTIPQHQNIADSDDDDEEDDDPADAHLLGDGDPRNQRMEEEDLEQRDEQDHLQWSAGAIGHDAPYVRKVCDLILSAMIYMVTNMECVCDDMCDGQTWLTTQHGSGCLSIVHGCVRLSEYAAWLDLRDRKRVCVVRLPMGFMCGSTAVNSHLCVMCVCHYALVRWTLLMKLVSVPHLGLCANNWHDDEWRVSASTCMFLANFQQVHEGNSGSVEWDRRALCLQAQVRYGCNRKVMCYVRLQQGCQILVLRLLLFSHHGNQHEQKMRCKVCSLCRVCVHPCATKLTGARATTCSVETTAVGIEVSNELSGCTGPTMDIMEAGVEWQQADFSVPKEEEAGQVEDEQTGAKEEGQQFDEAAPRSEEPGNRETELELGHQCRKMEGLEDLDANGEQEAGGAEMVPDGDPAAALEAKEDEEMKQFIEQHDIELAAQRAEDQVNGGQATAEGGQHVVISDGEANEHERGEDDQQRFTTDQKRADQLSGTLHAGLHLDKVLKYWVNKSQVIDQIAMEVGAYRREVSAINARLEEHVKEKKMLQVLWVALWQHTFHERDAWEYEVIQIMKTQRQHLKGGPLNIKQTCLAVLTVMRDVDHRLRSSWKIVSSNTANAKPKQRAAWDGLLCAVGLPNRQQVQDIGAQQATRHESGEPAPLPKQREDGNCAPCNDKDKNKDKDRSKESHSSQWRGYSKHSDKQSQARASGGNKDDNEDSNSSSTFEKQTRRPSYTKPIKRPPPDASVKTLAWTRFGLLEKLKHKARKTAVGQSPSGAPWSEHGDEGTESKNTVATAPWRRGRADQQGENVLATIPSPPAPAIRTQMKTSVQTPQSQTQYSVSGKAKPPPPPQAAHFNTNVKAKPPPPPQAVQKPKAPPPPGCVRDASGSFRRVPVPPKMCKCICAWAAGALSLGYILTCAFAFPFLFTQVSIWDVACQKVEKRGNTHAQRVGHCISGKPQSVSALTDLCGDLECMRSGYCGVLKCDLVPEDTCLGVRLACVWTCACGVLTCAINPCDHLLLCDCVMIGVEMWSGGSRFQCHGLTLVLTHEVCDIRLGGMIVHLECLCGGALEAASSKDAPRPAAALRLASAPVYHVTDDDEQKQMSVDLSTLSLVAANINSLPKHHEEIVELQSEGFALFCLSEHLIPQSALTQVKAKYSKEGWNTHFAPAVLDARGKPCGGAAILASRGVRLEPTSFAPLQDSQFEGRCATAWVL